MFTDRYSICYKIWVRHAVTWWYLSIHSMMTRYGQGPVNVAHAFLHSGTTAALCMG